MRRIVSAVLLFVAATLAVPSSAFAAEGQYRRHVVVIRVYDPYRHDYHRWDGDEERAYRQYLAAHHRTYVTYRRQRLAERRAYWHWRHEREERLERERR